jgi:hypothetical protein
MALNWNRLGCGRDYLERGIVKKIGKVRELIWIMRSDEIVGSMWGK